MLEFDGTLLLVSHDRAFDNVVTSTLVFEGDGRVNAYVGGYQDWLRQSQAMQAADKARTARSEAEKSLAPPPKRSRPPSRKKLSYKDQRELEMLPRRIQDLDAEMGQCRRHSPTPACIAIRRTGSGELTARLQAIETELAAAYARWEALEG